MEGGHENFLSMKTKFSMRFDQIHTAATYKLSWRRGVRFIMGAGPANGHSSCYSLIRIYYLFGASSLLLWFSSGAIMGMPLSMVRIYLYSKLWYTQICMDSIDCMGSRACVDVPS